MLKNMPIEYLSAPTKEMQKIIDGASAKTSFGLLLRVARGQITFINTITMLWVMCNSEQDRSLIRQHRDLFLECRKARRLYQAQARKVRGDAIRRQREARGEYLKEIEDFRQKCNEYKIKMCEYKKWRLTTGQRNRAMAQIRDKIVDANKEYNLLYAAFAGGLASSKSCPVVPLDLASARDKICHLENQISSLLSFPVRPMRPVRPRLNREAQETLSDIVDRTIEDQRRLRCYGYYSYVMCILISQMEFIGDRMEK